MNTTDRKILETALGLSEPLPLPNSQAEEVALEEMRLRAEMHGPARMRKEGEVSRVLQILDEIGKDGSNE